jgi:cation transport ATPase
MIIETLVISGLAAIGIKKYYRQRQQKKELNTQPKPPVFYQLYQKSKTHLRAVKKLLLVSLIGGEVRYQRLKHIFTEKVGYPETYQLNKNINLSIGVVGLALVGNWWYSPLLLMIATFSTFYLVYPLYQKLSPELQKGRVSIELFEIISIVGLLMMGYVFWAASITFISLLNLKLSNGLENPASRRIIKVFIHPQRSVWVMRAGMEMETPLRAVKKRDIIVVNTGEMIPVDGVITQGAASIDQYQLTGQLQPVKKKVGEKVFATTVVLNGRLLIRVTNIGANTIAAKMGHVAI